MFVNKPYKQNLEITSPFGDRIHPITRKVKRHKGVDVGMPEGTELYAPISGIVSPHIDQKGLDGGYGRYLILEGATDQGSRVRFIFAHLSEVLADGRVIAGNLIAKSGNTGSSTGAHLHLQLEMYKDNYGWVAADPEASVDFRATA